MLNRSRLLGALLCSSVLFAGCSGSDGDVDVNIGGGNGGGFDTGNGSGSVGGGSGGSGNSGSGNSGVSGQLATLDCDNLDPEKVYMVGSLDESSETLVVADVIDPLDYCTGFPVGGTLPNSPETSSVLGITATGKVLYQSGTDKDIKQLVTDTVTISGGEWVYPADPEGNDILEYEVDEANNQVGYTVVNAAGELLYRDGAVGTVGNIVGEAGVYYSNPTDAIPIGVNPDGSLLLLHPDGFSRESAGGGIIDLVEPAPGTIESDWAIPVRYISDTEVWIVMAYDSDYFTLRRWRLDLTDNSIVDEGVFADLPDGMSDTNAGGTVVIGSDGSLYRRGRYDGGGDLVVYRQPIASSGGASEILYVVPNVQRPPYYWEREQNPAVVLKTGAGIEYIGLITGR